MSRRLIHIDDDPDLLRLYAVLLSHKGFEVQSIADPTAAFDVIVQSEVDVVLSDVDMPHVNGFDLLRQIKEHKPEIQVVMLTASCSPETCRRAKLAGAIGCVSKLNDNLDTCTNMLHKAFAAAQETRT